MIYGWSIWVNYNISLNWNVEPFKGMIFPLLTAIPGFERTGFGRMRSLFQLPRSMLVVEACDQDYTYLVVSTPLKNISQSMSVAMIIPNIWKVIKFHGSSHHQPAILSVFFGVVSTAHQESTRRSSLQLLPTLHAVGLKQRPHPHGCYWNFDSSWNVHGIVCFFCCFLVSLSFISILVNWFQSFLVRFGGFRCFVVFFLCFCVMVFIWSLQTGGQITIQKIQGHWKDLGSGSLCQVAGRGKECQSQILDDEIPRRCVFPCWVNCITTVWLDLRKTSV